MTFPPAATSPRSAATPKADPSDVTDSRESEHVALRSISPVIATRTVVRSMIAPHIRLAKAFTAALMVIAFAAAVRLNPRSRKNAPTWTDIPAWVINSTPTTTVSTQSARVRMAWRGVQSVSPRLSSSSSTLPSELTGGWLSGWRPMVSGRSTIKSADGSTATASTRPPNEIQAAPILQ